MPMHTVNSIIIRAPREQIFEAAANLEEWPRILSHYRFIRYFRKGPRRNVVKMGCSRSGLPVAWTSEQEIDREGWEVRFYHLKGLTEGMVVVWSFEEASEGVLVRITHDLNFRFPVPPILGNLIIGEFFIKVIADKTLAGMKRHLER